MLQFLDIRKSYGSQVLFDGASFSMVQGERLALIGRNGSGKSTLFKLILGSESPDTGQIVMPKGYRCGHLAQHTTFSHPTVLKEACSGLPEEERDNEHLGKKILMGLGFSEEDFHRPPSFFSGGFQIRINLAKVLLSRPNLLLLDEPTNYLDIVSLRWLTRFLNSWRDEAILISHDRSFLDAVCSHSMIIRRQLIRKVRGDTGKLIEQVLLEDEIHEKTRRNLEKKREDIEAFINRFRAKASKASVVQSRIKALAKLRISEQLSQDGALAFSFTSAASTARHLLKASKISFSYHAQTPELLGGLSFTASRGERIGVIGKNGRGKSTLLRLLNREILPSEGSITIHDQARIGYFGQTNIETLSPQLTVEDEVWRVDPSMSRTKVRNICGTMMFDGDNALKRIGMLSGGEKSRVLLAKILAQPTNILLLDEPTNHLDMESVESLIEALKDYPGAVVIVTHSELILRELATRLVVFQRGGPTLVEGSYDYFLEKTGWEEEEDRELTGTKTSPAAADTAVKFTRENRKERSRLIGERSSRVFPLNKEMEGVEETICKLEETLKTMNDELARTSQDMAADQLLSHTREIAFIQKEIDSHFERMEWLHSEINRIKGEYEEKIAALAPDSGEKAG